MPVPVDFLWLKSFTGFAGANTCNTPSAQCVAGDDGTFHSTRFNVFFMAKAVGRFEQQLRQRYGSGVADVSALIDVEIIVNGQIQHTDAHTIRMRLHRSGTCYFSATGRGSKSVVPSARELELLGTRLRMGKNRLVFRLAASRALAQFGAEDEARAGAQFDQAAAAAQNQPIEVSIQLPPDRNTTSICRWLWAGWQSVAVGCGLAAA